MKYLYYYTSLRFEHTVPIAYVCSHALILFDFVHKLND